MRALVCKNVTDTPRERAASGIYRPNSDKSKGFTAQAPAEVSGFPHIPTPSTTAPHLSHRPSFTWYSVMVKPHRPMTRCPHW